MGPSSGPEEAGRAVTALDVGPLFALGDAAATVDVDVSALEIRADEAIRDRVAEGTRSRIRHGALLGVAADVLGLAVASVAASFVGTAGAGAAGGKVLAAAERLLVCVPVLYAVLAAPRRQLLRRLGTTLGVEVRDVTLPLAAGALLCLAGWRVVSQAALVSAPSDDALLSLCLFAIVSVAVARWASHTLTSRGGRRVVVVGSGVVAERLATRLQSGRGVEVVGFVDDDPKEPVNWLGPLHDLGDVCQRLEVDHVVVAFTLAPAEDIVDALRPVQGKLPISVVPRLFDVTPGSARTQDLVAGYPAVSTAPPRAGGWERAVKRVIDVAGGTVALVLATPVMVAAAIGVRLSSPGPILLRQVRVGRGGKEFTIWKFRSFTVTESVPPPEVLAMGELVTGPFPKLKNDPRTTAFGRMLRRTSIDELPQLFNVLGGSMSLVGPRPLAPDFAWDFGRWALRRYEVKPGLTGLWQVSGRNDLTYEEMCRLDELYATSWSLGLDLRILARTARAVVSGHGCY